MGKKSNSSPDGEKGRPSLLRLPVAAAAERLNERIALGRELLSVPIRSGTDLKTVQQRFYTWTEYNEALLRRVFDTEDEVKQYRGIFFGVFGGDSTLQKEIDDLHDSISRKVRILESLVARLRIYELAPEASQSEVKEELTPVAVVGTLNKSGTNVFIVHGRDELAKETVARLVVTLGLNPIILHEQANRGRTIIQKFMDHGKQSVYAIVLLTPDDVGRLAADETSPLNPRARQNVILELGFFLAALGPDRVCAVRVGEVETPSDFDGVLYVPYDAAGAWRYRIAEEMSAVGIPIDMNKLVRR